MVSELSLMQSCVNGGVDQAQLAQGKDVIQLKVKSFNDLLHTPTTEISYNVLTYTGGLLWVFGSSVLYQSEREL